MGVSYSRTLRVIPSSKGYKGSIPSTPSCFFNNNNFFRKNSLCFYKLNITSQGSATVPLDKHMNQVNLMRSSSSLHTPDIKQRIPSRILSKVRPSLLLKSQKSGKHVDGSAVKRILTAFISSYCVKQRDRPRDGSRRLECLRVRVLKA